MKRATETWWQHEPRELSLLMAAVLEDNGVWANLGASDVLDEQATAALEVQLDRCLGPNPTTHLLQTEKKLEARGASARNADQLSAPALQFSSCGFTHIQPSPDPLPKGEGERRPHYSLLSQNVRPDFSASSAVGMVPKSGEGRASRGYQAQPSILSGSSTCGSPLTQSAANATST